MARQRLRSKATRVTAPEEPVSDKAKLFFLSVANPLAELANDLNKRLAQVREAAALQAAAIDNKPPGQGWVLNLDRMSWQQSCPPEET